MAKWSRSCLKKFNKTHTGDDDFTDESIGGWATKGHRYYKGEYLGVREITWWKNGTGDFHLFLDGRTLFYIEVNGRSRCDRTRLQEGETVENHLRRKAGKYNA